jgi:pyruvate/2-oxoglutarate dehydrogenase complex dihydrolipoamide dehydrogenase (E3) component
MNDIAQDAGISCDINGFIIADDYQMTNDFDILACGDCSTVKCIVTGEQIAFASTAIAVNTGHYAGLNATGTHKPFPGTTRTRIAKLGEFFFGRTGLDASQAKTEGYDLIVTTVYANPKPGEIHEQKMILQMIFNKKNGRLLGAQAGGSSAIQEELDLASLALQNGMTAEAIANYEAVFMPYLSSPKHPIHYAAKKALREL